MDVKDRSEINEKDKIPISTIILYSIPSFSRLASTLILTVNILTFYEERGSKLIFLSLFTTLTRGIELIFKPIIAFESDNNFFPMGRRKPFMIFGCIFYSIFLPFLFSPPNYSLGTSLWFGVFYLLFFLSDTLCGLPYLSLAPELSTNTKEREKLYLVNYIFQFFGIVVSQGAPIIIKGYFGDCKCDEICQNYSGKILKRECLLHCDSECLVNKNQYSYIYISMFLGFINFIGTIILVAYVKEKNHVFNKSSSIIPTFRRIILNKPLMKLIIPYLLDYSEIFIFATISPFFITYIVQPRNICIENKIPLSNLKCDPNTYLGYTLFAFFISCIIFLFIWHILVKYFGKKKCWCLYSILSIIFFLFIFFVGKGNTTLTIIAGVLIAIPASGAYLNDAILSDIIDYDELLTGKRNEGIYIVLSLFIPKLVGILSQGIPLAFLECKLNINLIFI